MLWFDESQELIQQLTDKAGEHDKRRNSAGTQMRAKAALASRYVQEQLLPSAYAAPITLQLEITYACNLKCIMCYNNSGLGKRRPELSDTQWMRVAEEACDNGLLEAIISGGEPLLRKDLVFRLLDLFSKHNVHLHLVTNGFYLTPEIARRLAEYQYGFLQVSIDGHTAAIHDRVRGVPGSWERATRGLELLTSRGVFCRVAHTAVKFSYRHVGELIDLAIALGARAAIVGRVLAQGRGSGSSAEDELLLDEREEAEYWQICDEVNLSRGKYIQFLHGHDSAHALVESHTQPNWAAVIRPNGDVRIGCIAPFVFGNAAEEGLINVWNNGVKQGFRHPAVVSYIKEVIQDGELAAVRRLGLSADQENKYLAFVPEQELAAVAAH